MNAPARLLKIIDGTRCEAECACGVRFVSDRDEFGLPADNECLSCLADRALDRFSYDEECA